MTISDLIATAALIVALTSLWYARGSRDAAQKANRIATQNNLRQSRLEVYQLMIRFSDFCGTFYTLWHFDDPSPVKGTRNLVNQIDNFDLEIELLGPLAMPNVEIKISDFRNNAWKMQRLLDRLAAGSNIPEDRNYQTGKENLEAIVDWFANEKKELKAIFQPYLGET